MKKEVVQKCDICGKTTLCIYLEQWGGWICIDCYWGRNNEDEIEIEVIKA